MINALKFALFVFFFSTSMLVSIGVYQVTGWFWTSLFAGMSAGSFGFIATYRIMRG